MSAVHGSQGKYGCKSLLNIDLRRKLGPTKFSKKPENVANRRVSCMQSGPIFGSLQEGSLNVGRARNDATGRAVLVDRLCQFARVVQGKGAVEVVPRIVDSGDDGLAVPRRVEPPGSPPMPFSVTTTSCSSYI